MSHAPLLGTHLLVASAARLLLRCSSSVHTSIRNKILGRAIQQKLLDQFSSFFYDDHLNVFSIFDSVCYVCRNRQKTGRSLMYPIAWATACSSLQIFLLPGLNQSFVIAMLKLNSIIEVFFVTVVLIHRHCSVTD